MRRWTDGKAWSASRVSGSFLTYREMEGNKKHPVASPKEKEEGFKYKEGGLFKQSFSITTATGLKLHLISYYTREDVNQGKLAQPSTDSRLKHIQIPIENYPDTSPSASYQNPAVTHVPLQYGYRQGIPMPGQIHGQMHPQMHPQMHGHIPSHAPSQHMHMPSHHSYHPYAMHHPASHPAAQQYGTSPPYYDYTQPPYYPQQPQPQPQYTFRRSPELQIPSPPPTTHSPKTPPKEGKTLPPLKLAEKLGGEDQRTIHMLNRVFI